MPFADARRMGKREVKTPLPRVLAASCQILRLTERRHEAFSPSFCVENMKTCFCNSIGPLI